MGMIGSTNRIHRIHNRIALSRRRSSLTTLFAFAFVVAGLTGSMSPEFLDVSAAGRDRTSPTAPSNLSVTGKTTSSVSLSWNPSTDNSGNFFYRVRNSAGYEATAAQTQRSFTWASNLSAGQTYSFLVYAVDGAGNKSKNSNTVTVTLPPATTPPATPVVSVADVGPTHISLAWATTGAGPTLRYLVFKDGSLDRQPTADTSGTFYLLDPETTYTFAVQAKDGANSSPLSEQLTVTTEPANPNDTTPPTTPANLREDHWAGEPEIYLSWDPSADDLDAQSIIRYDVYVNGVLDDIRVGSNRTSVYVVEGFNTINVVAVDTAGNESAAATITLVF